MACEICGRSSCTRSFHSLECQDLYDKRQEMSDDVEILRMLIQEITAERVELKKQIEEMEYNNYQRDRL